MLEKINATELSLSEILELMEIYSCIGTYTYIEAMLYEKLGTSDLRLINETNQLINDNKNKKILKNKKRLTIKRGEKGYEY